MELVASLPPDIAALADPAARAAAPPLRPTDRDDAADAAAMPFELLLGLLVAPGPSGESLPVAGNALPAVAVDATCDSTAPSGALAKPVTPSPLAAATGADLLARLKLATSTPASDASPPSAPPAEAATAGVPFADLELAALPDVGDAKAAACVQTTAAAPSDVPPSDPDVAAALEAGLPQSAPQDATPKPSRTGQARAADQVAARSAVPTDLRAPRATAAAAPPPVADVSDAAARPVHRDATLETLALPATSSPGDAGAAPPSAPPALAPTQPHVATASASPADVSTLQGQGAAIDTRADHWHEALASRVQVLVDQHVGEAHIKLNPPELGSVDIKISLVDDKTFVQLTAANSAARDELTQSLPKLRELLSAGGLSLGGASVQGGNAGTGGQDAAPRIALPAYAPFASLEGDETEAMRPNLRRAAGRIDLFA